jgi:hypothetical protein
MTENVVDYLIRRVQRSTAESQYVNTLNVRDRVTIDFVWYPGAQNPLDSLVDTVVIQPDANTSRDVSYSWRPQGGAVVRRVAASGRIILPLASNRSGVLEIFGTSWQVTRVAAGVNMTAVNQLRGTQERLNRLGYHLRSPGSSSSGIDNVNGARTEAAVLAVQSAYTPTGAAGAPANRLQIRGEWTQNNGANYQNNIGGAGNNQSAADGTNFRNGLTAYVGG